MKDVSLSPLVGTIDPKWKIAIVSSAWHRDCTDALRDDAKAELTEQGIEAKNILLIEAPGSFEVPLLAKVALEEHGVDGVIAIGVIVQGETGHAEIIARESGRAIMDLSLETGKPVIYEILQVQKIDDARVRSIGKNGKGRLAARTLLKSLAKLAELRS